MPVGQQAYDGKPQANRTLENDTGFGNEECHLAGAEIA